MKEIVEKYVSVWNSNDISGLKEICSNESKYWDSTQEGNTMDVLANSITATHEAFSNVLFQVVSLVSTGDTQFFFEWQMTGTNTGEFFGYPPTGKDIKIHGLDSIKFDSLKVLEIKSFYDSGSFGKQLGL